MKDSHTYKRQSEKMAATPNGNCRNLSCIVIGLVAGTAAMFARCWSSSEFVAP
jgi:hypothetical protein